MVGWSLRSVRVGGGLLLLAVAACGGRTSTLDDGIYETGGTTSDGGSSATGNTSTGAGPAQAGAPSKGGAPGTGGSNTGGSAGVSVGGGGPAGSAGSAGIGAGPSTGGASMAGAGGASMGGSTGIDDVAQECAHYCKDSVSGVCPVEMTSFDECLNSCANALLANNGACFGLGTRVLHCIEAVLEKPPTTCDQIVAFAQNVCAPPILNFSSCIQSTIPPSNNCSSVSGGTQNTCNASMKCEDGQYFTAQCMSSGPVSYCTCSSLNTPSANVTLNEDVNFACNDALAVCGAPLN